MWLSKDLRRLARWRIIDWRCALGILRILRGISQLRYRFRSKVRFRHDQMWFRRSRSQWIAASCEGFAESSRILRVIVGEQQPKTVHALAHAINVALDAVNKTVSYTEPIEANPIDELADVSRADSMSFKGLVREMGDGHVQALFIVGSEPRLLGTRGLTLCRRSVESSISRASWSLRGRNRRALPLARSGRARTGILG